MALDWKYGGKSPGPAPPDFLVFIMLSRLNLYGVRMSVEEIERMDPLVLQRWAIYTTVLSPEDVNPWLKHSGSCPLMGA